MKKNGMLNKCLAAAVLCSISTGFCAVSHVDAANREQLSEYEMKRIIIEEKLAQEPKAMKGDNVNIAYGAGIMGIEDVNSIPFTVTSFTEKTINDYSDVTQPLPSILANNPSVRSTASAFYDDFSIRGQKINGYQLYLNNVPGLFEQGTTPTNYLGRIDVTAGPAMSLNMTSSSESAGGFVNMVSKKAELTPVNDITLGFSGRGTFTQKIDMSRRFGEDKEWGVRINALNTDGETSIANENKRQRNIFVNVDHVDSNSSTNLLAGYVDDSVKDSLRWFTFAKGLTYTPKAPDIHKNYGFKDLVWEADKWIVTLNHEQKIAKDWNAFVNAGYGRYDIYNPSNSDWRYTIQEDGTFSDDMVRFPFGFDNRTFQIGVKGEIETGDLQHSIVLATDIYKQKHYTAPRWTFGKVEGNLQDGITSQPDFLPDYPYGDQKLSNEKKYKSVKFVDNISVGDFNILAGVIRQDADIRPVGGESVKSHATSPLYGLVYKVNDEMSTYMSHSESFGKGSVVPDGFENKGEVMAPAKTKQNEIGIKYNNGDIMANLAYFDVTKENRMDIEREGLKYRTNDGEVSYKGVDLSVYGKLAEKWNVMGGFLYTDVKNEKTTGGKLDGIRKSGIPRWSAVTAVEYQADDKFSMLCRGTYNGSFTIRNEEYKLPSYFVVDLGAQYKTSINDTPVQVNAMIYNLFDKAYWEGLAGGDNLILSNPRTFMTSVTFSI